MRIVPRWFRSCAVAAAVVCVAASAWAQTPVTADQHKEHHSQAPQPAGGDQPMKPAGHDMMARMTELDARIGMLVADVNMLTGELKTTAMASLLTALVERDKAMRGAMMQMHEQMMSQMKSAAAPVASGEKPGMMCSMMKHETAAPEP